MQTNIVYVVFGKHADKSQRTMEKSTTQTKISGPETIIEIQKQPSLGSVFIKGFFLSFIRPSHIDTDKTLSKSRITFKAFTPDSVQILQYKQVCGFDDGDTDIPITYFQAVFTRMLGKYITSSFFPLNPMGLIHTFQSFEQKRPLKVDEIFDLSCSLAKIFQSEKGTEIHFSLQATANKELVWEGASVFLIRRKIKRDKKKKRKEDHFLAQKQTFHVPSDIGRQYAAVSGDYNPYHLYDFFAKLFGFRNTIAHGMWSMARTLASLEKSFCFAYPLTIETSFKLPVYLPAHVTVGYESGMQNDKQNEIIFELRDQQKGLPHLKGRLSY